MRRGERLKAYSEIGFTLLFGGMLLGIYTYLGWRVVIFTAGFSFIWFSIAMILLTRPPGIPEFVQEKPGSDEQYVVRREVIPRLPLLERLRLSLGVACGCCLLIWVTLVWLGR